MQLILCGIYLLLITAIGVATLTLFDSKRTSHWSATAAFAFATGMGLLGLVLFDLALSGLAPSRVELAAIGAVVAIVLIVRHRALPRLTYPRPLPRRFDRWTWLAAIALLVLLAAAVNVAIAAVTYGLSDIDAFGIWMLKAKIAYVAPLRPIPPVMTDPSFSYSHQDYPLGFPMVIAGLYAILGRVDEQLAKTTLLLPVYASLIAVMYAAVRSLLPDRRAQALSITAVFAAAPVLTSHAGMAVAEVSLMLMHGCCVVLLVQWMREPDRRVLIAAAAFAAFAAFTKNEGLALLPIVALVSLGFAVARHDRLLRRRRLGDCLIAWLFAAALIAPWLIYRTHLPRTHEDYGGKLTSLATVLSDLPRLAHILPRYLRLFVQPNSAGGIWLVLLVTAICRRRQFNNPVIRAMWILLLLHAALYLVTFVVTPWDVNVLLPMVGPKLLLHIAPTAALLIGLHLSPSNTPPTSTPH